LNKKQRELLERWFKKDLKSIYRERMAKWRLFVERKVSLKAQHNVTSTGKEITSLKSALAISQEKLEIADVSLFSYLPHSFYIYTFIILSIVLFF
jgi:hypothetical protein